MALILGYYDKDAETTLITDSPFGIAAVLIQHQINGQNQLIVIKYASKA